MEAHINDPASVQEVLSVQYRQRFLQFLSILGLCVAMVISPLEFSWGMPWVSICCLAYSVVCVATILMLQINPARVGLLSNNFIFCTSLVPLLGIYFETADAMVDPWILTCPVVSYALCNKQVAARWTVFTLLCLFGLRQVQLHKVAMPSTILLALAVVAMAIVLHLFSSHIEKNERLIVKLGNTDPLTNTLNRRSFPDVLLGEYRRNLRQQTSMTVTMVDVDHFKSYNDHYGHVDGDRILVSIAERLRVSARRPGDFVFRYGGEEFCILCSGADEQQAAALAETLRSSVETMALEHQASPMGKITVSIGYRHAETLAQLTPENLISEADKALYLAKANGRNRVERYIRNTISDAAA